MTMKNRYKNAWEGFWSEAPPEPGAVFWDADPALTAAVHLELFEPYLTEPGLPLVDLGCGNGTQTRYLATRLPGPVLGVDVSSAALSQARAADATARFRELDVVDGPAVAALSAELGDATIYMRGLLHQLAPEDRDVLAHTIATLLGRRGRAFVVEPGEATGKALGALMQDPEGPPGKLRPVLKHGITPGAVTDAELPEYFRAAGLDVLASGDAPLATTEHAQDGTPIELPSRWLVLGHGA